LINKRALGCAEERDEEEEEEEDEEDKEAEELCNKRMKVGIMSIENTVSNPPYNLDVLRI